MERTFARYWLLLIVTMGALEWIFPQAEGSAEGVPRLVPALLRVASLAYMFFYIIRSATTIFRKSLPLLVALWTFGLVSAFLAFFIERDYRTGYAVLFLRDLFWILALWTACALTERGLLSRKDLAFAGAATILSTLATAVFLWKQGNLVTGVIDSQRVATENMLDFQNAAYQVVAGMMLLYSGGKLRWNWNYLMGVASLCGLVVLGKRGAFLAGSLGTIAAAILGARAKYFPWWKITLLVGLGVSCATLVTLGNLEAVKDRLSDLRDPDQMGSNRGTLYRVLWDDWRSASAGNQIIGKGYQATVEILGSATGKGVKAHSDWLEMLVDFGLVGVGWLVLFQFLVVRRVVHLYRIRSARAPSLWICWITYLPVTMYSITLTGYPTAWYAILFGYAFADSALDDPPGPRTTGRPHAEGHPSQPVQGNGVRQTFRPISR